MALYDELYAINVRKTLAQQIDRAWLIYQEKNRDDNDRGVALNFLIYAFNLQNHHKINEQLLGLMQERNLHKGVNPEYIPKLSPKHLGNIFNEFNFEKKVSATHLYKAQLQSLMNRREILEVDADSKATDERDKVPQLTKEERAKYRVHIYQGKFYQNNIPFNSKDYISHGKRGYAAYTLNVQGELSVFDHHSSDPGTLVHSSLNAGAPVVSAGELVINEGRLESITTHSGHHQPSVFNVYRSLEHFSEHGIDISGVTIYTINDPSTANAHFKPNDLDETPLGFYGLPAVNVFKSVKDELNLALHHISGDIKQYLSNAIKNLFFSLKDAVIGSHLTHERKNIANEALTAVSDFMTHVADTNVENVDLLHHLIDKLATLKKKNEALSSTYGKKADSGSLNKKIDDYIEQVTALTKLTPPPERDESTLKLVF